MKSFVISVCGIKGGITKSTLSYCLAVYYSEHLGLPVNLLDLDQFNLSLYNNFYTSDFKYKRTMSDAFNISHKAEVKSGCITIADLPGNEGLTNYIDFIEKSNIVIFPTTPNTNDMNVLINSTITQIGNKKQTRLLVYNRVRKNSVIKTYDEILENNIIAIEKYIYEDAQFFDNITNVENIEGQLKPLISNDKMLIKLITKHHGFNELVKLLNNHIFKAK